MASQLIPLNEIASDAEFFRGTRFRSYKVGMSNVNEEDDYYEYLLVDNGDPYMLLVNSSSGHGRIKAGNVMCYVQKLPNVNRAVVTAAAMQYSMGLANIFLVNAE
ncbi:hypothetical protein GCM10022409_48400 [Hymenobacter glaciei]|uniref:Uncharacterized protein n=1 Tax=Hymenobacter glaciei TaxID=877209 RepID=A0ABP7UYC8_9BACT